MKTKQQLQQAILINLIKSYRNPYPPDIFRWDNKETANITMGRLNELLYKTVENTKEDIIRLIQEEE